jgi:hypothetical protein
MGYGRIMSQERSARKGIWMSKESEQIEKELQRLRDRVESLSTKKEVILTSEELSALVKYMVEERERTNRALIGMTDKIRRLEGVLDDMYAEQEVEPARQAGMENKEVPVSDLDSRIINFVQSQEMAMACADQVKEFMRYKGRNAACARLNRLYKEGLLDRLQLGHKVYYKYDAGKTTNTLIISPPQ